jgi:hypothetical protein
MVIKKGMEFICLKRLVLRILRLQVKLTKA